MVNNIYTLPKIDFVGGSSEHFIFNVYFDNDKNRPFALTDCTADFSIINFVNKNGSPILSKQMDVRMGGTTYNVLDITLDPLDTVDLFGKYVYQVSIKDGDNHAEIPQQGIIDIHTNINKNFLKQE